METSFWNYHDGIFTLSSPTYGQVNDDSDSGILDLIKNDYSCATQQRSQLSRQKWNAKRDDEMSILPMSSLENCFKKEDFNRTLSEWQDQLGSIEVSDSEDVYFSYTATEESSELHNYFSEHFLDSFPLEPVPKVPSKIATHVLINSQHNPNNVNEGECISTLNSQLANPKNTNLLNCDSAVVKEECDNENIIKQEFLQSEGDFDTSVNVEKPCIKVESDLGMELDINTTLIEGLDDLLTVPNMEHEVKKEPVIDNDILGSFDKVPVRKIKTEPEDDYVDIDIDVETVSEKNPVLEARDLSSLLEQFEASETFNVKKSSPSTTFPAIHQDSKLTVMSHSINQSPSSQSWTHQNIKDSLPEEVINKIKAASHKKVIPVIAALPNNKKVNCGTRMQDAAVTLVRNKLLKIVSSNTTGGESVQLDHDYCTTPYKSEEPLTATSVSFYNVDSSEYKKTAVVQPSKNMNASLPSTEESPRMPEVPTNKECQKIKREVYWEKNPKKDSGLESGDVSDASEETPTAPSIQTGANVSRPSLPNIVSVNGKTIDLNTITPTEASFQLNPVDSGIPRIQIKKEIQMVSVLKCQAGNSQKQTSHAAALLCIPKKERDECRNITIEEPKKKKLNIEEYRSRLKQRNTSCQESSKSLLDKFFTVKPKSECVSVGTNTTDIPGKESFSESVKSTEIQPRKWIKCETVLEFPTSYLSPKSIMCSVGVQTEHVNKCEEDTKMSFKKLRRECVKESKRANNGVRRCSSSSSDSSSHNRNSSRSEKDLVRERRKCCQSPLRRRKSRSATRKRSFWSRSRSSHSRSSSCCSSSSKSSSSSSSSSCSTCSSSSSSSSRYRSRSNLPRKYSSRKSPPKRSLSKGRSYHSSKSTAKSRRSRSRSPVNNYRLLEARRQSHIEERKVIYVGRIVDGTTKADLRKRFEVFGEIIDISVHFREHGDNYGFVTFANKNDAYAAIEGGNYDKNLPKYDISFGGRRAFCRARYSDLDGAASNRIEERATLTSHSSSSFDDLLREAQAKLRKRKI